VAQFDGTVAAGYHQVILPGYLKLFSTNTKQSQLTPMLGDNNVEKKAA